MRKLIQLSLIVFLTLIVGVGGFTYLANAQNVKCYIQQGGNKIVALSGCEYEFRSGSTLDIQSGTNVEATGTFTTSDLNVTDDATISSTLVYSQQTALTVTDGGTIAPTGTYQLLTAAGAVGASISTSCTAGTVYHFENTANQTITITDTGNIVLAGNAALGQYDTLTVICDGTRVVELARANN